MAAKRLLAIGGAEDREEKCEILKKFVELAGEDEAEILIMTIATGEVRESIKEYRRVFRRLGVRHVKAFDISAREDTVSKRGLSLIENATGIGSGSVIIVDGGSLTHTNLNELKHGELLELHDLSLHVLPPGARFDIKKQRPIVDRRKRRAAA